MLRRVMMAAGGEAPSEVSFVAASDTTYVISTAQSQTIPAAVAVDDLLLAFILHRDNLNPPAGWVLVDSQSCATGITQYTSVYRRTAQAGDAGASSLWTQATSQRMAVHIQAFRKAGGATIVASAKVGVSNTASNSVHNWAVATATAPNQIGVACCSSILAVVGSITNVSASSGTLTTPPAAIDNRLEVAYVPRSTGESTVGTFITNTPAGNSNGVASVSVIVG